MRNPNGYGSVIKLSGNRRNPYGARITLGFNPDNGYPVYKFLGYYASRKDAMTALALYHNNPEAVAVVNNTLTPTNKITLQKAYEEWSEEHYKTIKNPRHYKAAYKILEPLKESPLTLLKIADYENVFTKSGKNKPMLNLAKIILKGVYAYSFRKGYVDESAVNIPTYISLVGVDNGKRERQHKAFTHDQIEKLWECKDMPGVENVLFMIYTGLRISELAALKCEDIHLDERWIAVKESKTKAGIRKVPINEKLVYIIEKWLKLNGYYFVPLGSDSLSTRKQPGWNGFEATMKSLGFDNLQHDTRFTCSTLLVEAGVDDRYVKLIVGHKQQDVTNKIYAAKLDISVLIDAINQI